MAYDSVVRLGFRAHEANLLPDFLIRRGARALLAMRLKSSYRSSAEDQLMDLMTFAKCEFVAYMHTMYILVCICMM